MRLTAPDVAAARARIAPHLAPTPLRRSFALGPQVLLKLECQQPTGSFKVRGALSALSALTEKERAVGVVAASAGNHALGVAFAAEALRATVPVTLFVPASAPQAKIDKLRTYPVTLRIEATDYDDAHRRAAAFAAETGAFDLHAFEDARTASGQGTVALELLEQCPDIDTVLVPVGGGGLISGMAVALKAVRPHVRVIAVQPAASPALRDSLRAGRPLIDYTPEATRADGLAGGIGHVVWDHRDLVDDVVEVTEAEIADAIVSLVADEGVLAEASGAT